LLEYVKAGFLEMAGVQGRQQILLHLMPAATNVDQAGASRHLGKESCIQDPSRFRGKRKQADEDVRSSQYFVQAILAVIAGDALDLLGRATPARDIEVEARQHLCRVLSQYPQAKNAHPTLLGRHLRDFLP